MDLKKIIDEKHKYEEQFEPEQRVYPGVLMAVDYPTNADVIGEPGSVWVRPLGQSEAAPVPIINMNRVPSIPNLRVLYKRGPKAPHDYEIYGIDNGVSLFPGSSSSVLPNHAKEHEWGGRQPVNIYLRALTMLRLEITGSAFLVNVIPANISTPSGISKFLGLNNYDLGSHQPGAGLVRVVLCYIDVDMDFNIADGTAVTDVPTITIPRPALPVDCLPIAYVKMRGDVGALTELDIIEDARAFLTLPTGSGSAGTPSDTVEDETTFGLAADEGIATEYSRGDHTHGSPTDPVTAHEAASDPHPGYLTPAEHTAIGDSSPHHAPITLDSDADVLLGLSGQVLSLDTQSANTVLAGPTSGGPADPTFRALVDADVPAAIARDSEVSAAIAALAALAVLDGDGAGGVLSGSYPSPGFAVDMAEQGELDAVAADLAAHLADTVGAHAASAISIVDAANDFTATDVEAALAELQAADEVDEAALAAHIADTTDAHAGTAITNTPAGNIAATTVQAALNELDTEKAALASAVMDGDTAGGVLSGTYPNPGFAADMATQAELDAHAAAGDPHTGYALEANAAADLAAAIHAATTKATPIDADELALVDSAASNVLKKLTWANVKATLLTWLGTLLNATKVSKLYNSSGLGTQIDAGGSTIEVNSAIRINQTLAIEYTTSRLYMLQLTSSNADGARLSSIKAAGRKADNNEDDLVQMSFDHDGAGDDYKGRLIIYVSDAAGALTEQLRLTSAALTLRAGLTASADIDLLTNSKLYASDGSPASLTSSTSGAVTVPVSLTMAAGATVDDIDTAPADDDTALITSGGVWDHTNASAAVHGLGANVHVMGHRAGAGRFAQSGTVSNLTTDTAASMFSAPLTAGTFAVAFSATPVVVGSLQQNAAGSMGFASITTSGFNYRVLLTANSTVGTAPGYIAIGT